MESPSPGHLKLSLDQELGKGKNKILQLWRAILSTFYSVQQVGECIWLLPTCVDFAETSELYVLQLLCWFVNLYPADCPSAMLPGLEVQHAGPLWSGAFGSHQANGVCCLCLYQSTYQSVCPSVYLPVHISTYLFVRQPWSQTQTGLNSSIVICFLLSEFEQGS